MSKSLNRADEDVVVADILNSMHVQAIREVETMSYGDSSSHYYYPKQQNNCCNETYSVKETASNLPDEEYIFIEDGRKTGSCDDYLQYHYDHQHGIRVKRESIHKKKTEVKKYRKMTTCDCGAVILERSFWKHNKSKKHVDFCRRSHRSPQEQLGASDIPIFDNIQGHQSSTMLSEGEQPLEQPLSQRLKEPLPMQRSEYPSSLSSSSRSSPTNSRTSSNPTDTRSRTNTSINFNAYSNTNTNTNVSFNTNTTNIMMVAAASSSQGAYNIIHPPTTITPTTTSATAATASLFPPQPQPQPQPLMHYSGAFFHQNLFSNQIMWMQHPFYSYPMMVIAPHATTTSSSSSSMAPQCYYLPSATAATIAAGSMPAPDTAEENVSSAHEQPSNDL